MTNNTGGPAFPVCDAARIHNLEGMTLRDYFAAKAMQELIGVLAPSDCARKAYQYANEMLKAREQ